jgi:hypothetical protein
MLRQAAQSLSGTGQWAVFAAMENMLVSDFENKVEPDGRNL